MIFVQPVLLARSRQLGLTLALCALLGIGASLLAIPAQPTIQDETRQSPCAASVRLSDKI